ADLQGDSNPHMMALRPWNIEILGRFFPTIDLMLKTQKFLTGDDFTVADIAFVCVLREIRKTEVLSKYPHIEQYCHRCQEREAFAKVLNAYEERLGIEKGSAW